ncbi:MAG: ABC transporter ATP-binding protein [Bacteroidota bacterium]
MIQIQNASKSFKGTPAVQDLTLDVGNGEIFGLLGANGAGKSTTINMLLGFLSPDSGSVQIKGMDSTHKTQEVQNLIGYISENVSLYPYLSGLENLDYFCRLAGLNYSKGDLQEILSTCGLQEDAQQKRVADYSKGMRQKVGIAIAYAKKAEVYLLDEPASGLDPLASNELSALLKKLAAEGATILMASHDIFRVREVCDRIGILKKGSLVKELSSEEVSANELENLYISYMKN